MSIEYPDLADYLAISAEVTGTDLKTITNAAKLDLADSALHAPLASFGGEEFSPEFCDKAACSLSVWPRTTPFSTGTIGPPGYTSNVHRDECMAMDGLSLS